MKREDLEKMAAQVVALVAKETAGDVPKPGTPQREMMDLGIKLAVDTLSLFDRAVVALEKIAAESRRGA